MNEDGYRVTYGIILPAFLSLLRSGSRAMLHGDRASAVPRLQGDDLIWLAAKIDRARVLLTKASQYDKMSCRSSVLSYRGSNR